MIEPPRTPANTAEDDVFLLLTLFVCPVLRKAAVLSPPVWQYIPDPSGIP